METRLDKGPLDASGQNTRTAQEVLSKNFQLFLITRYLT